MYRPVPFSCLAGPRRTEDRAIATARYKSFARDKGRNLIERTERALVEGLATREEVNRT
ncbi:MAG: hypothetical protein WBD40_19610 [Tepidisphaeraceae bacterium]